MLFAVFCGAEGFIAVSAILSSRKGRGFSVEDVQRVVTNCHKQRFALQDDPSTGQLQIRANQGHTIQVSECYSVCVYVCGCAESARVLIVMYILCQVKELELDPIQSADEVQVVVHGTYRRAWAAIEHQVTTYGGVLNVVFLRVTVVLLVKGLSRMKRAYPLCIRIAWGVWCH